ncbi:extracellular catalytic domain type 1 short-chain-length polyhydroxyalkanoate depolymerase [Virgisporangium aurantiacum]|nr:PHB depolymerase family esterase [Virgisporangium aurantiacum]
MARSISLLVLLAATLLGPVTPAAAATLTPVSGFGSNPGNLSMYSYRPDGLPSGAPLVVAFHGCGQTATEYFTNSGWRKYADLWRFALVLPQTSSANNSSSCFNWFEPGDQSRGQGEALSVKQMVDHAVANVGVDAGRVFVTGLSAGGAMTAVMLAAYPDVFRGGAVIAGIAYKCATTLTAGVLCLSQRQNRTPQQWGDLARGAFPGYAGRRPVVSIWYGTNDYTVATFNADQLRDQWTNVNGVGQSPTGTQALPGNTVREDYGATVQVYRVSGIGHGTPVDPGGATDQCGTAGAYFLDSICSSFHIGRSWGLDGGVTPPTDPPTTPPAPVCVRASNWAHVRDGRAHDVLGSTYANGSDQAMGLTNVFVTHTLRQTGPNFWVLADSGC